MKLRLAAKILKAQLECRTKKTNAYWVERWNVYDYAVYPCARQSAGHRDHRIDKSITVWHKTPRNRRHKKRT